MAWIAIGDLGMVQSERIVAIGHADSAPMRRLIAAAPPTNIVVLTGGRRRRTVILLDSEHIVITALTLTQLQHEMRRADLPVEQKDDRTT